jgi:hypothetical protein
MQVLAMDTLPCIFQLGYSPVHMHNPAMDILSFILQQWISSNAYGHSIIGYTTPTMDIPPSSFQQCSSHVYQQWISSILYSSYGFRPIHILATESSHVYSTNVHPAILTPAMDILPSMFHQWLLSHAYYCNDIHTYSKCIKILPVDH